MFGLRKKGPTPRPFAHADNCPIVKAEPGFEPEWQEVKSGHWQRLCQCGGEHHHEEPADRRARLDPRDPATARHAVQCEYRDTTDPAILRAILRVRDGLDPGYWWVECGTCECAWQVPYYAPQSVG